MIRRCRGRSPPSVLSPAEGLTEVLVVLSNSQGQQNSRLYVTDDGEHAVIGDIIPFGAHPFTAAQEALNKGMNGPSRGPADAPVTVVEFSDLQCPHCKEAQPTIDKLMAEEKNARLVFQNFPLQSHDWAAKAADYGDCIGRTSPDAFWKYVASVYAAQNDITATNADEKLTALAEQAGAKGADTAACAAKPETAEPGAAFRRVGRGARSHRNADPVRERKKDQQRGWIALRSTERSDGIRRQRREVADSHGNRLG